MLYMVMSFAPSNHMALGKELLRKHGADPLIGECYQRREHVCWESECGVRVRTARCARCAVSRNDSSHTHTHPGIPDWSMVLLLTHPASDVGRRDPCSLTVALAHGTPRPDNITQVTSTA